jgi:integrase
MDAFRVEDLDPFCRIEARRIEVLVVHALPEVLEREAGVAEPRQAAVDQNAAFGPAFVPPRFGVPAQGDAILPHGGGQVRAPQVRRFAHVAIGINNEHVGHGQRLRPQTIAVKAEAVIACQTSPMPSPNTERAYRSDWADFSAWCAQRGVCPLPSTPADLTAYVADLATKWRAATVRRRLAAIAARHRATGLPSPTADPSVKVGIARAERDLRDRAHPTEPLGRGELRALVDALPDTVAGTRDRAMILLGIGAGLRRSELAGLQVGDVESRRGALRVKVRDRQESVVRTASIPPGSSPATDAPSAWAAWIAASGVRTGPAFRAVDRHGNIHGGRMSDSAPAAIVKRSLLAAGLDPRRYGVGSLRRGLVYIAARAGLPDRGIAAQTGHRTLALVREYMRRDDLQPMK